MKNLSITILMFILIYPSNSLGANQFHYSRIIVLNGARVERQYLHIDANKGFIETSYSDLSPVVYFCNFNNSSPCIIDTSNKFTFAFDHKAATKRESWEFAGWIFRVIHLIHPYQDLDDDKYFITRTNKKNKIDISFFYYSISKGLLMFDIYSKFNKDFLSRSYWRYENRKGFGTKNDSNFNSNKILNDKEVSCLIKLNTTNNIYESCLEK